MLTFARPLWKKEQAEWRGGGQHYTVSIILLGQKERKGARPLSCIILDRLRERWRKNMSPSKRDSNEAHIERAFNIYTQFISKENTLYIAFVIFTNVLLISEKGFENNCKWWAVERRAKKMFGNFSVCVNPRPCSEFMKIINWNLQIEIFKAQGCFQTTFLHRGWRSMMKWI